MPESDFLNKSKIFGSGKQLTKYQEAINEASYSLYKNDGSLLMNKGKLLQLAREKLTMMGTTMQKEFLDRKCLVPLKRRQRERMYVKKSGKPE